MHSATAHTILEDWAISLVAFVDICPSHNFKQYFQIIYTALISFYCKLLSFVILKYKDDI